MQNRIEQAKKKIRQGDGFQQKRQVEQDQVEQLSRRQQELIERNAKGIQSIVQAMDDSELNQVLREIERRLHSKRGLFSRKKDSLKKEYPDPVQEYVILSGRIKFPHIGRHIRFNGIEFVYNTYREEGLKIVAKYDRDEPEGSHPDAYEQVSDTHSFSSVEELVDAIIDGIAYFDLGEPESSIENAFLLTRERD